MPSRSNGFGRFPASRASCARSTTWRPAWCGRRDRVEALRDEIGKAGFPVFGRREHSGSRRHQARQTGARPLDRSLLREHSSPRRVRRRGRLLQLHAALRLDADRSRDAARGRIHDRRLRSSHRRRYGSVARAAQADRVGDRLRRTDARAAARRSIVRWTPRRCGPISPIFWSASCPRPSRRTSGSRCILTIRRGACSACPESSADRAALERLIGLVDSPANGITFCTGSLGALATNDLPAMIRSVGRRIHFAHCRNVRITGDQQFYEAAHPTRIRRRADARGDGRAVGLSASPDRCGRITAA